MTSSLWENLARHWARLGPPLRPSEEDLRAAQAAVDACAGAARERRATPLRAVILGVTPELRRLRWPTGTRILAADLSMAMIRGIGGLCGPDCVGKRGWMAQADWCRLPLADEGCDIVLGDASLTQLNACRAGDVLAEVARTLGSGGTLAMRVFLRPNVDESPDAVWSDLLAGRIADFHTFKLRLLAALHSGEGHVAVADAWAFFAERCAGPEALAERLGWPEAQVRTIEAYRGQSAVYWLPTLAEFRATASAAFDERSCYMPAYELGDRCPTFVLRARGSGSRHG